MCRENLAQIKHPATQIVALDELHSYVGYQKTTAGFGLQLIDLANATSLLSLAPKKCRAWDTLMEGQQEPAD